MARFDFVIIFPVVVRVNSFHSDLKIPNYDVAGDANFWANRYHYFRSWSNHIQTVVLEIHLCHKPFL